MSYFKESQYLEKSSKKTNLADDIPARLLLSPRCLGDGDGL